MHAGCTALFVVSLLLGLVIEYTPISPMKALFWSAFINGVIAVPLIVVIISAGIKKTVMGRFTASRPIILLGWLVVAVMGTAAIVMLIPD
jgi:Mn2+/Fe2+ NRAMP family transporter